MASTLSRKWLPIFYFLLKSSKSCIFRVIQVCSNFTGMFSKYFSNNEWTDFRLPMSTSVTAMVTLNTRSEINFCSKLQLKLFRATVANADTRFLKSLCTLFDTYLNQILAKCRPNRIVQNVHNFELYDQKPRF